MSKLDQYYSAKKQLEDLLVQLKRFESDPELKKALEFQEQLRKLMAEYDKDENDVVRVLGINPSSVKGGDKASSKKSGGGKRALKTYRNPHTGEVVQTRGGNHKVLNAWRQQYGKESVDSWLQD